MVRFSIHGGTGGLLVAAALSGSGCTNGENASYEGAFAAATRAQPLSPTQAHPGKKLFERPFRGSNGRSCATCHVLAENTTLRPESVAARLAANPADPLFNRLDADDP